MLVKMEDEEMDELPDMSFVPLSPTGLSRRSVSVQPADGSIKESNKAVSLYPRVIMKLTDEDR